ncbi:MAG: 30S ribosomal protein S7 [Candidatus Hodarchaeales archaeon]|jgi:small subunit ribosomal protein S7
MGVSEGMKIFGLWDSQEIEIKDIGLLRYINLRERLVPHSAGRHEHKRFHKSHVHIVERLANKLMSPGKNTGKKILALNAVKSALSIIELKTNNNPIQILVDAIVNCAPREETTRISYGGIVYHTAVDSAPQRRVDVALRLLAQSVKKSSFNNVRTFDEILAEQLILASSNNPNSVAIKRKQDIERVALSAR